MFFPLRVCVVIYNMTRRKCVCVESYAWDGTGESVDGVTRPQQEGFRKKSSPSSPLGLDVCCRRHTYNMAAGQRDPHFITQT